MAVYTGDDHCRAGIVHLDCMDAADADAHFMHDAGGDSSTAAPFEDRSDIAFSDAADVFSEATGADVASDEIGTHMPPETAPDAPTLFPYVPPVPQILYPRPAMPSKTPVKWRMRSRGEDSEQPVVESWPELQQPPPCCMKCKEPVNPLVDRPPGSKNGQWKCTKCNTKHVRLIKMFGRWPCSEFANLDPELQDEFWKTQADSGVALENLVVNQMLKVCIRRNVASKMGDVFVGVSTQKGGV